LSGLSTRKGLTVFEILVVMIIVSILALLALPFFLNFGDEYRATALAQNLYYAMQYARSEAIKRDTTVYVNFQTGTNWCYGINPTSNCNCSITGNCTLGTTTAPTPQISTLAATGTTSNSLSFDGVRGAAGGAATITFTVTGQTPVMGLDVGILGDMYLCSSTISGYSGC
jgi:type IV fimbrial biogenesis protein FimT